MSNVRTTITNLVARRARTGIVFSDGLLDAIVGLLEQNEALERRVMALEVVNASAACGDEATRLFLEYMREHGHEAGDRPADPSERA